MVWSCKEETKTWIILYCRGHESKYYRSVMCMIMAKGNSWEPSDPCKLGKNRALLDDKHLKPLINYEIKHLLRISFFRKVQARLEWYTSISILVGRIMVFRTNTKTFFVSLMTSAKFAVILVVQRQQLFTAGDWTECYFICFICI